MLNEVRKPSRAKSMLAYFLFGAIIVVFIGFGVVPDRMSADATGVAAVVNRHQISLSDFRDRVQNMERQFQMRMDQVPAAQREEMNKMLRQRALEDLIQFEVMIQDASARGVRVADEEIRDTILEIPAFQDEGRFKRDNYDRFLKERQWSAGQFESRIRKDLMMRKVQTLFQDALLSTSAEKAKDQALSGTKFDLEVVNFNEESLKSKIPVSDSEVKLWLAVKENAEKAQQTYKDNQLNYSEPEQVRARHILIAVDRSKPEADAAAKAKISEIQEKAKSQDFGKLATEYSDDTGTKKAGGELGFFSKGRMVPEFEAAAFSQPVGQVGAPVKTDFGYHLIKVEERKSARTKPFEEVQVTLARSEIAQTKMAATIKGLEDKVVARDEVGVRKSLKDLGLALTDTGEFTLDTAQIPQVSDTDRVIEALLKHKVKKGLLPEVIKGKGENQIVLVKTFSVKPASTAETDSDAMGGSRKFYDAFAGWAKGAVSKASIKRNASVLK